MAVELATAYVSLVPSARGMSAAIGRELSGPLVEAGTQAGDEGSKGFFRRFGANAGPLARSAGRTIAIGLGAGLAVGTVAARRFVDAASDLEESQSRSATVFGESGGEIETWAGTASDAFGQSRRQALDAAGTFGNLFTQLGIGSDQAAGMSTSMVELASDFASFHNADVSDVLDAQSAAFRGEYDAVQRFVPTINAAAVEQKAMEMGLADTTSELDAQDKALATQALLMGGAGDAAGDFARTSDGLANKQRILSAQWEDMQARIGQAVIPMMGAFVDVASRRVLPALEALGEWMSENKNVVAAIAAGIGTVLVGAMIAWGIATWQAVAANIALGTSMLPMIATVGAIALAVGALVAGVIYAYTEFDTFRAIVDGVVAGVKSAVEGFITGVTAAWRLFGDNITEFARATWDGIRQQIDGVLTVIRGIFDVFAGIFTGDWRRVWDGIKGILSGVWTAIQGVVEQTMAAVKLAVTVPLEALEAAWRATWGGIRDFLGGIWEGIKGAASGAWEGLKTIVSSGVNAVVGFVKGIPGQIADVASSAWDGLTRGFKRAINAILRIWNGIEFPSFTIGGWDPPGPGPTFPSFTSPTIGLPNVPLIPLATGGVITHPMAALVGDNPGARFDPEIVAPRSTMMEALESVLDGRQAAPVTTITVTGVGLDEVASEIVRRQRAQALLNGGRW